MTVGTYTSLGWRPARVNGSRVAHLVPKRIGPLSRTACEDLPLGGALLEPALGLLLPVECCRLCLEADGTDGPARDGRTE